MTANVQQSLQKRPANLHLITVCKFASKFVRAQATQAGGKHLGAKPSKGRQSHLHNLFK